MSTEVTVTTLEQIMAYRRGESTPLKKKKKKASM